MKPTLQELVSDYGTASFAEGWDKHARDKPQAAADTKEANQIRQTITAILDAQQALEDAVRTFCEAKGDDVPMALLRNLAAIDKLKEKHE